MTFSMARLWLPILIQLGTACLLGRCLRAASEDAPNDETSLLQAASRPVLSSHVQPYSPAISQQCPTTPIVPVKGTEYVMPARGMITCCSANYMMTTDVPALQTSVEDYLRAGGRLIDTAPDYGSSESAVGKAVVASNIPRHEIWLQTKIDTDHFVKSKLMNAAKGLLLPGANQTSVSAYNWTLARVDSSLRIMNLSYLDSIVLHFGPAQAKFQTFQDKIPTDADFVQMWRALIDSQKQGKVRLIGVCESTQAEVQSLIDATGETPAVALVWYNPWMPVKQRNYVGWLKSKGIAVQAYGLFTQLSTEMVQAAERLGRPHNATWGQFIIQWALDQGIGFTTSYHGGWLREDMQCLGFHTNAEDRTTLGPELSCEEARASLVEPTRQFIPGCQS